MDAAIVLDAIAQRTPDPLDPATSPNRNLIPPHYSSFVHSNGLKGARIGVARDFEGFSPHADAVFENALTAMTNAGATLVDVFFPHIGEINSGNAEFTVLLFDFKIDLRKYLATRQNVPIAGGTLADAIAFNLAHASQELKFFGQEIFDLANSFSTDPNAVQPTGITYNQAVARDKVIGGSEGIDLLLSQNNLDAIVAPTDTAAWPTDLINGDHFVFGSSSPCAIVGYPIINVPSGNVFGLPVGISFMGTAFSEPKLIKLASGFEAVTNARIKPQLFPTLPLTDPTTMSTTTTASPTRAPNKNAIPRRI
jgi:amidase